MIGEPGSSVLPDSANPTAYNRDAVYILDIKTREALTDQDADGTCDPFLRIWIDGDTTSVRTNPRRQTLEPMWVESRDTVEMVFPLTSEQASRTAWNGSACLHFECWDEDSLFNDFIGYGRLPLSLGTTAPFVRFHSWAKAEQFVVQLWNKKGQKVGALSVRLSCCLVHNFIDRWIANYYSNSLFVPSNQRMTASIPFSALTVPEQPAILRELLQNVSNRLVRSWLSGPCTAFLGESTSYSGFVGKSMIAALLFIHGALPEEESDTNNNKPPLHPGNDVKSPTSSLLPLPKRPLITNLSVPPVLRSLGQVRLAEIESIFAVGQRTFDGGTAENKGIIEWKHNPSTTIGDLAHLAQAATAAKPMAHSTSAVQSTNTMPSMTFKLSASERHAAQRDATSLLSKQVNALLVYLCTLLEKEYMGSNLMYGNRVRHSTIPISDLEIKENVVCYFSLLVRVTEGGGWHSLLNPEKWSGTVVSTVWNLIFNVPAFNRVDWNDEKNDPLCQSLFDSTYMLIRHNDLKHSLKSRGALDLHTDCFGSCGLKTTHGDAAESNPYAMRVRRATAAFPRRDKVVGQMELLPSPYSAQTGMDFAGWQRTVQGSAAYASAQASVSIQVGSASAASNVGDGSASAVGTAAGSANGTNSAAAAGIVIKLSSSSSGFCDDAELRLRLARVHTDIGSTTPLPSLDEAKRLSMRLQLYAVILRQTMFVAGGLERAAIANALDVLFRNGTFYAPSNPSSLCDRDLVTFWADRFHIEAHYLHNRGDDKSASDLPARDGRDAERLKYPLLEERPWFLEELEVARWVAAAALNAPFTNDVYFPIVPKVVSAFSDHSHNPWLVMNYKRFMVLNGFINYLTGLPPGNLAVVIQSTIQVRNLVELTCCKNIFSSSFSYALNFVCL